VQGVDRWDSITLEDLFPGESEPAGTGGADAICWAPEVATVVVPDLYAPYDLVPPQPADVPAAASPRFEVCAPRPAAPADVPSPGTLEKLRLDPTDPEQFLQIVDQQQELVQLAENLQVVALLDVPPGLRPAQVLHWRSLFDSSYAAGYHPWLRGVGAQDSLVLVPPSAVAAGVIARCELREGISRGAANEVASSIVDVKDLVDDQQHAELHRLGVDVYRMATDGVYLTSARTLSMDPTWRQLSVRRLLLLIERAVRRQLQWTVFEPNDQQLREGLQQQLNTLLAALFDEGCFAGATAQDSWFVNVASGALLSAEADSGQLIVEVGVAPSEPIEYIVVRVAVQAEGTIMTTVSTGPAAISHA
jgi:phage tail sheath protein FI